jgi:hypothetical protein
MVRLICVLKASDPNSSCLMHVGGIATALRRKTKMQLASRSLSLSQGLTWFWGTPAAQTGNNHATAALVSSSNSTRPGVLQDRIKNAELSQTAYESSAPIRLLENRPSTTFNRTTAGPV